MTRILISSPQLMIYLHDGLNNTQRTQLSCALKLINKSPLSGSQSLTVRSRAPDTKYENSSTVLFSPAAVPAVVLAVDVELEEEFEVVFEVVVEAASGSGGLRP